MLFALSFGVLLIANPSLQRIGQGISQGQPYKIPVGKNGQAIALFNVIYTRGQNTVFVIEPYNFLPGKTCIKDVWVSSPQGPIKINKSPICSSVSLTFSPYLHEGVNRIALAIHSGAPEALLYINPRLFGACLLSTLACTGLVAAAALTLFGIGRKMGLDMATAGIAIAGMAYYAFWLHARPNLIYTPDIDGHIPYALYMARSWRINPYNYMGHENFHPPTYYFLAGRVFNFFNILGIINPLTGLRIFSLTLYMTFCLFGLRTLHEAVERKGAPYFTAALVIMFWPVAINTASNISDDLAIYALWGAAFYYLARWFRQRQLSCLAIAVGLAGIAFMVKGSALVLIGIVSAGMLYGWVAGRLALRQLWQGNMLAAYGLALMGGIVNMGRIIYEHLFYRRDILKGYFGYSRNDVYSFHYYTHLDFHDFTVHTYATFLNELGFWNYFLKTWLYSPYSYRSPLFAGLSAMLNVTLVVFLVMIGSGVIVCLAQRREAINDVGMHLIGVLTSIAGIIGFTIVERYQFCQDFRYVLPMLVPLAVLFVYAAEAFRTRAWLHYWATLAAGLSLSAESVVFYLSQYHGV